MVKEVEFSNKREILSTNKKYSINPDTELFTGTLKDDGVTLDIQVNTYLPKAMEAIRKVYLYFGNVDFDIKMIDYVNLGETEPDYCLSDGVTFADKSYSFDLSKVLTIPRKVYNTQGTSEITVELYTYESNINTDYGTKRLSVPYTMESNTKYKYDKSTDGVYKIILLDVEPWTANTSTLGYGLGDIVHKAGVLIKSIIDNNTLELDDPSGWEAADEQSILDFSYGSTKFKPVRSVISDVLISRYAKYSMIKESLLNTAFKSYDDDAAYAQTLLLQNIREKAKIALMMHRPVDAAYALQLLKLASSSTTETTKITNYNIKYTS